MAAFPSFSLDETFGALLIGFTVSVLLFGICTTQLYLYIVNFPKDARWLQLLVFTVCLLELVHLIASAHAIYTMLVTDFGKITTLMTTHVGFHISGIAANLVSAIVKGFFIFRIWSISKSILLVSAISLLGLAAVGSYFAATILGIITPTILEFGLTYEWIIIFSPSMSAATDVSITIALCFLLQKSITAIGHSELKSSSPMVVQKITAWTLETGLLTSAFQLALAISAGINPLSMIWTALWLCTCRVYANSMLATLNGRISLRSMKETQNYSLPTVTASYSYRGERGPNVHFGGQSQDGGDVAFEGLKVVKHIQHEYS